MANPEHVEIVKQGADAIEKWRERYPDVKLELSRADLSEANLSGANLRESDLSPANLINAELSEANLSDANLSDANLSAAHLSGANLGNANLNRATLLAVAFDSLTNCCDLKDVRGCRVNRYTLEYMRESLSQSQMMDMEIHDDIATLRSQFGGVWGFIHLVSLITFCLPYAYFVAKIWTVAKFMPTDGQTISVWEGLLKYIWSGGKDWHDWTFQWSFCVFLLYLIYNVVRVLLLLQTMKLETDQRVRNLPAKFALGTGWSWWNVLFQITRIGYWVMLVLVAINTFHFLTMRVPFNLAE